MWSRNEAINSMPPIVTWPTAIADGMKKEHQELFNSRFQRLRATSMANQSKKSNGLLE